MRLACRSSARVAPAPPHPHSPGAFGRDALLHAQDVGTREISRRVETILHQFVKGEVDIDLLIRGAIKRPDLRVGVAATRRDFVREKD